MATYYVDTDSPNNPGAGTTDDPYRSLSIAEAALDTTLSDVCIIICRCSSGSADTTAVTVDGFVTSAANYLEIKTSTSESYRHPGYWSETDYRLVPSDANALTITDNHVRVDGLQLSITSPTAARIVLQAAVLSAANDIRFSNLVVKNAGTSTIAMTGIQINNANAIVKITNCVVITDTTQSVNNAASAGILCGNSVSMDVFHCTVVGGLYGIRQTGGTLTCKNCYAHGARATAYTAYSGTITQVNCAASDTSADGTDPHDSIAYSTSSGAYFTNVSDGSQNFTLKADSGLIGHGADLSGETAPLNCATDIIGTSRPQNTWDIGAFEHFVGISPIAGNINVTCGSVTVTSEASGTDLSPSDGNIIVTAGAVTLTQTYTLAPSGNVNVTCGSVTVTAGADVDLAPVAGNIEVTCDAVTLTQTYTVTPEANVNVSCGAVALTQTYGLPTADSNIEVTCGAATLTQTYGLPTADSNIAVTCGAVTLGQVYTFSPEGTVKVTCGSVVVGIEGEIVPSAGNVIVTCDAVSVTQKHDLTPLQGNVTVTCDAVSLVQTHNLSVSGTMEVTCGAVTLGQTYTFVPEGNIVVSCGAVALGIAGDLVPPAGRITVTCSTVEVTQTHALAPVAGNVTVTAGTAGVDVGTPLVPVAGNIAVTCGAVTLTQAYALAVDGGYLNATVDAIIIEQKHVLSMSDCAVRLSAGTAGVYYISLTDIIHTTISSLTRRYTVEAM